MVAFAATPSATADAEAEVIALIDAGHFQQAEARITQALTDSSLDPPARDALGFQRERMRRILLDLTLSRDDVEQRVRKQIPDLKEDEFAKWDAAGLFEHQVIDGKRLYFNRSPSNLFRLSDEALARRDPKLPPLSDGQMSTLNAHHREVRDQAIALGKSSVAPRRIRVTQGITVNADAVPAGETVRAWIPFPRARPGQQEDIRFIESTPGNHQIAPESTLQRTVYLEKPAQPGQPTQFSITYEVTIYGQYFDIDPDKVVPVEITPELAPFVDERAPHVVFSDDLRLFSAQVVGDEKNPYRIAQKLFAAVDKVPWAGAREYSTISNIPEYVRRSGHGDCGQQTLLLMTLLRMNGIPARWQSGMVYSDGDYWNLHDWGWMYLAPYGWVPMDVTTGRFDPASGLEWFYLGGFDAYRIAFNDDYSREFVPAKQHFRSETVDLQRGEVEWSGGNLYFDQWDYDFKVKILPLEKGRKNN
ncbi:transglutaminase-like putative cysteine protease [Luteimonas cucumeris]|uniref:Transglutaminase-like putative cysteine protease n=1 Tax=Luteimonas cucumeris TaxID=985012 RepID=A0A562L7F5_9GAMM|nr:transglutaminase-like domain-containing protein [Luteimonas cucumeris]TWI03558.1 transglutaminase-like putative cysteine protease [Luteimonas cucumeris]